MKIFKKCISLLLVCAMVSSLCMAVFPAKAAASTYTAQLNTTTLPVSLTEQKVVMTVEASDVIPVDGVGMTVVIPKGWSIASVENDALGFTSTNVNLTNGQVIYSAPDAENHEIRQIAKITYNVPAGAVAGTYRLGVRDLVLSADHGTILEDNGTAYADLTIEGSSYIASLDKSMLTRGPTDQTVVMTVETVDSVLVDGLAMEVVVPEDWTILSVENDQLPGFGESHYNRTTGRITYANPAGGNIEITKLAVVTYNVPAGTPTGTYRPGICGLTLSADYGNVFVEEGEASAALVVDGNPYIAAVETASIYTSPRAQKVVVTVDSDIPVSIDGMEMSVVCPTGWTVEKVENSFLPSFGSGNFNRENGRIVYGAVDGKNHTISHLATITYTVPASVDPGSYTLGIRDMILTADYGSRTLESNGTASAVLVVVPSELEINMNAVGASETCTVYLTANLAYDCSLYLAAYDSDGMMLNVLIVDNCDLAENPQYTLEFSGTAACVKAFMVEIDGSFAPLNAPMVDDNLSR